MFPSTGASQWARATSPSGRGSWGAVSFDDELRRASIDTNRPKFACDRLPSPPGCRCMCWLHVLVSGRASSAGCETRTRRATATARSEREERRRRQRSRWGASGLFRDAAAPRIPGVPPPDLIGTVAADWHDGTVPNLCQVSTSNPQEKQLLDVHQRARACVPISGVMPGGMCQRPPATLSEILRVESGTYAADGSILRTDP